MPPPRCALALVSVVLLAVAGCGGTRAAASGAPSSGISGLVFIGPTCPVERVPPQPGCRDRPYAATLWFRSALTGRVVRTTRSDIHGRFRVVLVPGTYVVEPRPGSAVARPLRPRRSARVWANRFTALRIDYDSGIR